MILIACKKNLTFKYPTPTHWYDESLSTKSTNTYEKSKILNKTGLPLYIDVKTAISDLPIITDNWRID